MRSTANASVNFTDGAVCSAVAQVNRSAAALNKELREHVEELLEGRKVECCFTSGHFEIVHVTQAARAAKNPLKQLHKRLTASFEAKANVKREAVRSSSTTADNPLAQFHQRITAHIEAQANVKPERVRPSSAQPFKRKADRSRPTSAHSLTQDRAPNRALALSAQNQKRARPSSATSRKRVKERMFAGLF
jgi:hypothetical protein